MNKTFWIFSLFFLLISGKSQAQDGSRFGYDPGLDRPKSSVVISKDKTKTSCFEFDQFSVKEVDLGGKGSERISLVPAKSSCDQDLKEKDLGLREHYFWGSKDEFVFFRSADSIDGFSEVVVYNGRTGVMVGDFTIEDQLKIISKDQKISLEFRTRIKPACDLSSKDKSCWALTLKENAIPARFYSTIPKCPKGGHILSAPVRVPDLKKPTIEFLSGNLVCRKQH